MKFEYELRNTVKIDWLKTIPQHWDEVRLGSLFEERKEKVSDKDFAPLSVTKNGIVPQLDSAAKTNDGDNRKKVCAGDFVINSRSDRKGSSGIAYQDGSVSLINIVLEPREVHPKYSEYLLKCYYFKEEYYRNGRGIVEDLWTTRYSEMKNMFVPRPPIEEQERISKFLDAKICLIDSFIRRKNRLIELIKEQKAAIINKTVTEGLNNDSNKKHSNIEGIGLIPNHWNVSKLKYLTSKIGDGLHATPIYVDSSDIFFINGTNLKNSKITVTSGTRCVNEEEYYKHRIPLKIGTILISLNGTIGNLAFYNGEKVVLGKSAAFIECKDEIFNKYIYYYLQSEFVKKYFNDSFSGTTINNLSLYTLRNTPIIIPSKQEQIAIVDYIEDKLQELDKTITSIKKEIKLTEEYLIAIIAEAVTGKIDVRNYTLEDKLESVEA